MPGRSLLIALSVLFLSVGAAAAEPAGRPAIEWLIRDAAPYHIPDGYEVRGTLDELVDWLAAERRLRVRHSPCGRSAHLSTPKNRKATDRFSVQ